MKVEEALKYARYAKVSVGWLLTGQGRRSAEGYGIEGDEMLKRYPPALQRAARALVELEPDVTQRFLLDIVERAHQENRGNDLDADTWLAELKSALRKTNQRSGLRPSARLKTAK